MAGLEYSRQTKVLTEESYYCTRLSVSKSLVWLDLEKKGGGGGGGGGGGRAGGRKPLPASLITRLLRCTARGWLVWKTAGNLMCWQSRSSLMCWQSRSRATRISTSNSLVWLDWEKKRVEGIHLSLSLTTQGHWDSLQQEPLRWFIVREWKNWKKAGKVRCWQRRALLYYQYQSHWYDFTGKEGGGDTFASIWPLRHCTTRDWQDWSTVDKLRCWQSRATRVLFFKDTGVTWLGIEWGGRDLCLHLLALGY